MGTHYRQFGIFLLNDPMGSRVNNIIHKHHHEGPECINMAILQEWMEGRGQPLTWDTLVKTLENIQLKILAKDIRDVKQWHCIQHINILCYYCPYYKAFEKFQCHVGTCLNPLNVCHVILHFLFPHYLSNLTHTFGLHFLYNLFFKNIIQYIDIYIPIYPFYISDLFSYLFSTILCYITVGLQSCLQLFQFPFCPTLAYAANGSTSICMWWEPTQHATSSSCTSGPAH